jgi:hypothetical protein
MWGVRAKIASPKFNTPSNWDGGVLMEFCVTYCRRLNKNTNIPIRCCVGTLSALPRKSLKVKTFGALSKSLEYTGSKFSRFA